LPASLYFLCLCHVTLLIVADNVFNSLVCLYAQQTLNADNCKKLNAKDT